MNGSRDSVTDRPHVPETGEVAPDFELRDSTGTPRRLSALLARSPHVLIFYRGYW